VPEYTDLEIPLTDSDLERMAAIERAATPGPWQWYGLWRSKLLELRSTAPWRQRVLDFARWGMTGAQPRFHSPDAAAAHQMVPAAALTRPEADGFVNEIPHPDAVFLAEARAIVPRLLTEVRRCRETMAQQQAEIGRLEAVLGNRRSSNIQPRVRPRE